VRRVLFRRVPLALLLTLVFVSLLPFGRLPREPVVETYVLVIGGLACLTALAAARFAQGEGGHSQFERALKRRWPHAKRPERLEQLERHVALASESAFDLHFRLRPTAVTIASERLWNRHGIDLEAHPDQARRLLSPELWALVRPDRPPPANRLARGPGSGELARLVDALERI
jgi:hypothetical protein